MKLIFLLNPPDRLPALQGQIVHAWPTVKAAQSFGLQADIPLAIESLFPDAISFFNNGTGEEDWRSAFEFIKLDGEIVTIGEVPDYIEHLISQYPDIPHHRL